MAILHLVTVALAFGTITAPTATTRDRQDGGDATEEERWPSEADNHDTVDNTWGGAWQQTTMWQSWWEDSWQPAQHSQSTWNWHHGSQRDQQDHPWSSQQQQPWNTYHHQQEHTTEQQGGEVTTAYTQHTQQPAAPATPYGSHQWQQQ